ncbi:hypothetical protein KSS87_015376 [Heliosperma pusillum]|nr:hypothetical protein KSS87_015376 [Heliosperma pusillum]
MAVKDKHDGGRAQSVAGAITLWNAEKARAPRTATPVCHTTSSSTSVISLSLASFSITTVSIGFCDFNLSFTRIHPTTADEADELYSDEVGVTKTCYCGGTLTLLQCYCDVTAVLLWCYYSVTTVLLWCY